ncbi:competence protein ComGC [Lacticaseibacillus chiayiensis]|uniref:Competence protein ComGC n=2 Tax=Lacticaseibacillus chiayiensis TaxID=2100821 RepID=A0A4Q1TLC9_9LACO|nr:type II secretion system protein [Lacticaseibacillus chiayiensis]RXT19001.1 competence protein ComGC [Lacticaseibacillus chiayiensis]RXT59491.1 competence protein ComGC [Lacticaseibacillus chiayiensis]
MKRLSGFTMIEIVAVMFLLTALALVAVPVGRGALTHRQEREFMERIVEEWEMLKMKARSENAYGYISVTDSERQVRFSTMNGTIQVLKLPPSLIFEGSATLTVNEKGKMTKAGSLTFKYPEDEKKNERWRISFQLGWGRATFVKIN